MDEYYDPRYDSSQGRWVTYDADAGAVWEPLTVAAPTGQFVTTNADAGGQWQDFTPQQTAAAAAAIEANRQAELQRANEILSTTPLAVAGDQVQTRYGDVDVSRFFPVSSGQPVTAQTPTQLRDPQTNAPVYLRNANDPFSYTYENTGIPAISGTVGQQAALYRPLDQGGVFGTLGSDFLEAIKDPYFKNFALAAATMAAGAALAPAASGASGAQAFPVDFSSSITTSGGLGAGGAAADFGSFIAADAAASAAGQGAFDLAASLGMPLDQAVTAGLINGSGNLTQAGAAALMGVPAGATSLLAPAAAAPSASTLGSLFSKGAEVLSGSYGDIIKGGLTLGGLAAASALAPKQKTDTGQSGFTNEQLQAIVSLMPSAMGQYLANAQGATPNTGIPSNSMAQLFPGFSLPTTGAYGAGRFGTGYAPTAPVVGLV